jgi:hypothetical protein
MTVATDIPPGWAERPARDRKSVKLATNTRPDQPVLINTSSPAVRAWIREIAKSVREILRLRPAWNGPGSQPVNWKNLEKLLRVLHDVGAYDAPNPQLVPLSSGGVQAEWHFLEQSIEIGISADGEIFAFATDEKGDYVVELEESWFIPRSDWFPLRRAILSYAERVRVVNMQAQGTEVGDGASRRRAVG